MEQIISKHIVKPHVPTPVGLKIHRLSSLDQVSAPLYIPLIFFYQNNESKQHKEISQHLRQSLSEILTVYYPLAGITKENSFVDCNDRGVEFVEAQVHARLKEFTQDPKMEELRQFIPVDCLQPHSDDSFILAVKANYFDCGGVAVGVCLSHKIGDASSFVTFMNSWAATCRGETSAVIQPAFDFALQYPPADYASTTALITKEKIVTKRIVFEGEKLEKLKKKAAASSVEALSVFIWRNFIEAYKAKVPVDSPAAASFITTHAVNLRPRTVPPFPNHSFGNFVLAAAAVVSPEEDDGESGVHVSRLRAGIRAVDADFIDKTLKDDEFFRTLDKIGDLFKGGNCFFSSWWRFPMYDVDFGWGKPAWISSATMPCMNTIIFLSTPSGDGIEAWVNAGDEQFFKLLESNYNQHQLD